jgi:RNA polymerase sigma-70 factor (ECF subfamily)
MARCAEAVRRRRARGGSLPDAALGALYDRCGARLYRYALLMLADPPAAEDAVQEAFCRLAPVIRKDPEAVTVAYAAAVVRNECYTILRKRRRSGGREGALLEPASPEATAEERLILEQALAGLPVEQREVIYLKVFEGMTFREIGELCGVSVNTAASRHRYALAALRRALAPWEQA